MSGHVVGPELGPNCLQYLSADKKVATRKHCMARKWFLLEVWCMLNLDIQS